MRQTDPAYFSPGAQLVSAGIEQETKFKPTNGNAPNYLLHPTPRLGHAASRFRRGKRAAKIMPADGPRSGASPHQKNFEGEDDDEYEDEAVGATISAL
jgi:hypothetical protein